MVCELSMTLLRVYTLVGIFLIALSASINKSDNGSNNFKSILDVLSCYDRDRRHRMWICVPASLMQGTQVDLSHQ